MKIYAKEARSLEGTQYLKGWHEVDKRTALKLLENFPMVFRVPGRAYGEHPEKKRTRTAKRRR